MVELVINPNSGSAIGMFYFGRL